MRRITKHRTLVLSIAILMLGIIGASPALARGVSRVDAFKPGKDVLRIVKPNGSVARKDVASNLKVILKDTDGNTSVANVNELADGAKVLGMKDPDDDGEIEKIILRELPSGSSDCSFDSSDDIDDDGESYDESFDCSLDYDGDNESESKDCSFDKSGDQELGDRSKSLSWDCSYDYSDDENDSSWDCSFDASEDRSADESGGTADGDFSFDCSWDSSLPFEAPLWECSFDPGVMGFTCRSDAQEMEFGYAFDVTDIQFDATVDFHKDYVSDDEDESGNFGCTSSAGAADCSFDGEADTGTCSFDFSFSKDGEADGGSVDGDASYSCDWEAAS